MEAHSTRRARPSRLKCFCGGFLRALSNAQRLGRRVSIHSRRAANDVVKCLEERVTSDRVLPTLPILHWFSGSVAAARKAAQLGFYFSINHASLEYESGLALIRSLPVERLLTETDGPFTTIASRKTVPADVTDTPRELARARGVSTREMEHAIRENAARVLGFVGISVPN